MHHTRRLYSRYRYGCLRIYIFLAKLGRIPLVGNLVRWVAGCYSKEGHQGYILTLQQAKMLIDAANGIALGTCNCRQVFHNCHRSVMTELVIGVGLSAFSANKAVGIHEITRQESHNVLQQCPKQGLIHTAMRYKGDIYALCNCCACCCVPIRLKRDYGIDNALDRNKDC